MSLNVLLVEPDSGLTEEIRRAFGPAGFSVSTLAEGEPVVDLCREERPDLVVLAAELPDMSGFSVCNRLKRVLSQVPLILCTADATDAAIEAHRATRTHADEYLRKPFQVADLLARASALVGAAQASAATSGPSPFDAGPLQPQGGDVPPGLPGLDLDDAAAWGSAAAAAQSVPEDSAASPGPPGLPGAPAPRRTMTGMPAVPHAPPFPPSGGPPPMPPPMPGARHQQPVRPRSALRAEPQGPEALEVLAEPPRDPAPPKGTPEEKLEYFRERLKARDAFLGKVRDAVAGVKAHIAQLGAERDLVQHDLDAERARSQELEQKLAEAAEGAAAQAAKLDESARQLAESENTRQSLSDVLSETMQEREASEQEWSARLAQLDAERAKLEGQLAEQTEATAKAAAALEAARAEADESAARALQEAQAEREKDRAEAAARQAQLEEQIASAGAERERLAGEVQRLEGEVAARAEETQVARREGEEAVNAIQARLDEANSHAESLSANIEAGAAKMTQLEDQLAASSQTHDEELRAARDEARAHAEKALAVEHALQGKTAELVGAGERIADLARALEEGRATVEGTRGEMSRIDAARTDAERRLAQLAQERDELARQVEDLGQAVQVAEGETGAYRDHIQKLEAEIARLAKLEPIAEEAARLRKEVPALKDMLQQRTSAAESSSRAAQSAAAERARAEERLAVEGGKLQAQLSRAESELGAARHRLEEIERESAARDAALRKAAHDLEERRKALAADAAESERRHGAEVSRLKAAMVDLERHLEARARSELTVKKRLQELERAALSRPAAGADPAEVARLRAQLGKLAEEVEELKSENDFLNGEMSRYQQKGKDLPGKAGRPGDVTKVSPKPSRR